MAQPVPSIQVPAIARQSRPLLRKERRELIQEAVCDKELWGFSLRVLVEIDYHYNEKAGDSFPSQDHIAKALDADRRAVRRAIDQLIERGYVCVSRSQGKKTIYSLREPLFSHHEGKYAPAPLYADDEEDGAPMRQDEGENSHSSEPELGTQMRQVEDEPEDNLAHGDPETWHTDAPLTRLEPGTPQIATQSSGNTKRPKPEQKPAATARATRIPDDFDPSPEMIEMTIAKGLSRADVLEQTEQFKLFHGARGKPCLDWNKAWHYWMNQHKPGGRFSRPKPRVIDNRGPEPGRNTHW